MIRLTPHVAYKLTEEIKILRTSLPLFKVPVLLTQVVFPERLRMIYQQVEKESPGVLDRERLGSLGGIGPHGGVVGGLCTTFRDISREKSNGAT